MTDRHGQVRWMRAAGLSLLACCSWSAAQDLASIRDFVHQSFSPPEMADGTILELEIVTEPSMPLGEARRAWENVKDRPDHPDRARLERQLSLHAKPEVRLVAFGFSNNGDWFLSQEYPGQSYGMVINAGGSSEVRWQNAVTPGGSQLSIIRSGVPFPAMYNIGQLFDLGMDCYRTVTGRFNPQGAVTIGSVDLKGSAWVARARDEDSEFRINGDWQSGRPCLRRVEVFSPPTARSPGRVVSYEPYKEFGSNSSWMPSRVTVVTGYGTERHVVSGIQVDAAGEVRQRSNLPEVTDDVMVADFRSPGSDAHARYAGAPILAWVFQDGDHQYDVSGLVQSASGAASDAVPTGGNVGRHRWIVIATSIVVISCVGLLIRMKSSRN